MQDVSSLVSSPRVTAPRALALVDGQPVNIERFDVTLNALGQIDTWEVDCPFFFLSSGSGILTNSNESTTELLTEDKIEVEIYVGDPPNPNSFTQDDLGFLISGYLDEAEFLGDMQGERVQLTGRSFAGAMADDECTAVAWLNRTTSNVATLIAKQFGLTPVVTPSSLVLGNAFGSEAKSYLSNTTYWDLLTYMASFDNYVVRVVGKTLYYGPYGSVGASSLPPAVYAWGIGGNVQSLDIGRSPTGAKDIKVEVKSYDALYKTSVDEIAQSRAPRVGKTIPGQYVETLVIPGLTRDQAAAKARAVLAQLNRAEIQGTITVVGDPSLTVDRRVQFYGAGNGLDLEYYVSKAQHTFQIPQLQMGSQAGPMNEDGYSATLYLSSQLLLSQTNVVSPLGTEYIPISPGTTGPTASGTTLLKYPVTPQQAPNADVPVPKNPPWLDAGVAKTVSGWLEQACILTGVVRAQWIPGMLWLLWHENPGGNPGTVSMTPNTSDLGQHATGLYQFMPTTFNEWKLTAAASIDDPVQNAAASIRYIQNRYQNVNNIPNIFTGTQGDPNEYYTGY